MQPVWKLRIWFSVIVGTIASMMILVLWSQVFSNLGIPPEPQLRSSMTLPRIIPVSSSYQAVHSDQISLHTLQSLEIGNPAGIESLLESNENENEIPASSLTPSFSPKKAKKLKRVPKKLPLKISKHRIRKGESLGKIAKEAGIDVGTLLSFNKLSNSNRIYSGQLLKIPNQKGILHKVRSGESLYQLSLRYQISMSEIQRANHIPPPYTLYRGKTLFLPGASYRRARHSIAFLYPVHGRISSKYGKRMHPLYRRWIFHRGIDIACRPGTPVKAAKNGIVTKARYWGGYGFMVEIKHKNGYITRYAHNKKLKVRKGQRVRRGQVIALSGSSGHTTGPHLHFEIRRNNNTINPAKYLARR